MRLGEAHPTTAVKVIVFYQVPPTPYYSSWVFQCISFVIELPVDLLTFKSKVTAEPVRAVMLPYAVPGTAEHVVFPTNMEPELQLSVVPESCTSIPALPVFCTVALTSSAEVPPTASVPKSRVASATSRETN